MSKMEHIRNFVIMAHVDHGKSTLADRFLEVTKTIDPRKMQEQYLDMMELERERGITIKMAPVRMQYHTTETNDKTSEKAQAEFTLNLIDTPGHSDFSYEVSRALAAVEGAILLVDATQGVQAQTMANLRIGNELGLTIIPAINKIDLNPDIEELREELMDLLDCGKEDIHLVSGKTGEGVKKLLDAVVAKVPPPSLYRGLETEKDESGLTADRPQSPSDSGGLRALIFDSLYDPHKGIIAFARIFNGKIDAGDELWLCATEIKAEAFEIGYFAPELTKTKRAAAGDIGYIALGLKDHSLVRIGDTITHRSEKDDIQALEGYREPQPVVFASFYPQDADNFDNLQTAVEKLHLTDASFTFEIESSDALGRGFRLGFLGTLHLEIIAERIRREFGIEVITTAPSVAYKIHVKQGDDMMAYKPQDFPPPGEIEEIEEPIIEIDILSRRDDYGTLMQLASEYRMEYMDVAYHGKSVEVSFLMPLAELLGDFYDTLKSITSGYASVNYEMVGYEASDVQKVDILLAEQEIPEFAKVVHVSKIDREARKFVKHLKEVLPRENFPVKIQARAGGRIIAREDLPALKKDVTGHLYGGDRTRKMKLWKKQKEGKKKLLNLARVNIPHDVYIKILRGDK